jgi:diguanylate cyclase (GGDEF)-like protein
MSAVWVFFENMNEVVCVSDVKSHEIVYMNRFAMELYGISSPSDYRGKKCYEMLQGSSGPCSICSSNKLRPGQFKEWQYFNPFLQKEFLVKDTMVVEKGRLYRVEIAIDMNSKDAQQATIQSYINNESLLNEALRLSLSSTSSEESIEILMEYVGKSLKCERIYIFEEKNGEYFDNTYEWCAQGVVPQIDNLHNVAREDAQIWLDHFKHNQNVVIYNIEDTKETDPAMYDILYPQDIHSLITSPLTYNNKIIGFFGVDNPPVELMQNISTLFMIMGHFITSLLRRRDLMHRLERLSYYDQLTGFNNRHGMEQYLSGMPKEGSIGVIYGDVTGLKQVNDSLGHKSGDALLVRACKCIKKIFPYDALFRIGGDEFLIISTGISKEDMFAKIAQLKEALAQHHVVMALGYVWRPQSDDNIDTLLSEADRRMYSDKQEYYKNNRNPREA